ncbi:dTDP-4-dehydrorhamnose reductase [Winogradskyella sp. PG-2]|uniref:dTDP-4-dehydrorhamnose reductase n=1 Tax=Winogradskyella sp. PG-2 TaxID=754409 RepID=UPI0004587BB1|nr:dTDP-4-dehydrorhamnose reductase [Winogradskyella sp. PG-2]BAO75575.1 dTDP-4-dehydrorhamnose reductase [Winogradskyella sp. PG-2]
MKTILVTGANGQLGQCLRGLVSYSTNNYIFLSSSDLDITNKESVQSFFFNNTIDWCINCAAYTQVDKAEEERVIAYNVNALAPGYIARACKDNNVKLIHISTDFVFNGNSNIAYTEKDKTNPLGSYGKSKLDGELFIIEETSNYFIIRTSWLYSEYANNFMKKILELSESRDELGIVSDQIGTPTYAVDLAKTIIKIIELDSDKYGIYHYSNEGVASWYDFAHSIIDLSKKETKINPILAKDFPTLAQRPIYSVLSKLKIKSTFGIKIPYWKKSLETAIINLKNDE